MMKNIVQNLNLDVKGGINIPPNKVAKPNLVGFVPRRLLCLPTTKKTTAIWKRKKVWGVKVEEMKLKNKVEVAVKSAFGFGFSAALSFCIFCHAPTALAQSLTVAFPVSRAPEVSRHLISPSSIYYYYCLIFNNVNQCPRPFYRVKILIEFTATLISQNSRS
jgi:hypothetical protein